ncbi:hypothetical protein ABTD78_23505, partial [Acinetobacter baumannii]
MPGTGAGAAVTGAVVGAVVGAAAGDAEAAGCGATVAAFSVPVVTGVAGVFCASGGWRAGC